MPPVLEFERLSKRYPRAFKSAVHALQDFSLSVEAGEIFGFLGPNGAGKTTAIHIAMGFMRPTSGGGRILGERFGNADIRSRVGFLAENVALYHRPAEKAVCFYGALNGMDSADLHGRAREVLDALDLSANADRNISKFSRGMLQRVGLAQALVNDPDLLILDEPTSALDPLARVSVRELLLTARKQGKTIFLSSHLLAELELICDRIAILHRGRLLCLGRTAELLESRSKTEIVARGVSKAHVGSYVSTFVATANGLARFVVPTPEQRDAIHRVWAGGGEVVSVNPVRRSLEELFVELTRKEGRSEKR